MSNGSGVTRQSRDCPLDVSPKWRTLGGQLAAIGPVVVLRSRGDWKKTPGMVTPVASTRKPGKNEIMTNLVTSIVIVELTNGRARSGLDLCYGENSLEGENEQTDTSRRLSCPSDSGALHFAGCSCCTYTISTTLVVTVS